MRNTFDIQRESWGRVQRRTVAALLLIVLLVAGCRSGVTASAPEATVDESSSSEGTRTVSVSEFYLEQAMGSGDIDVTGVVATVEVTPQRTRMTLVESQTKLDVIVSGRAASAVRSGDTVELLVSRRAVGDAFQASLLYVLQADPEIHALLERIDSAGVHVTPDPGISGPDPGTLSYRAGPASEILFVQPAHSSQEASRAMHWLDNFAATGKRPRVWLYVFRTDAAVVTYFGAGPAGAATAQKLSKALGKPVKQLVWRDAD